MEESRFDTLLRKAAQTATRRETIGALIAGVLLLNGWDSIEATRKAEKRKKRERREHKSSYPRPRGIIVQIYNSQRAMNYSTGRSSFVRCCEYEKDASLPPYGVTVTQGVGYESPWLWLDDGNYWFEFTNPIGRQPYAEIAINGRYRPSANCCRVIPYGQTVEKRLTFDRNQVRQVNIEGAIFRIERKPDSETFMYFDLHIPPNA